MSSIPLLKEKVKVKTVTTSTFDSELKLTNKLLVELIRHAGYEIPDDATFKVDGVCDKFGADILIDEGTTLDATWKTVHRSEREE